MTHKIKDFIGDITMKNIFLQRSAFLLIVALLATFPTHTFANCMGLCTMLNGISIFGGMKNTGPCDNNEDCKRGFARSSANEWPNCTDVGSGCNCCKM